MIEFDRGAAYSVGGANAHAKILKRCAPDAPQRNIGGRRELLVRAPFINVKDDAPRLFWSSSRYDPAITTKRSARSTLEKAPFTCATTVRSHIRRNGAAAHFHAALLSAGESAIVRLRT